MKRFERESDQEEADYQARLRAERQLAAREAENRRVPPPYPNEIEEYEKWIDLKWLTAGSHNRELTMRLQPVDRDRARLINEENYNMIELRKHFSDPRLRERMLYMEKRAGYEL